jgi:NAD(P)H-dependent flavin oxidoreductase YrpB (nitropropane dioxygenase family)
VDTRTANREASQVGLGVIGERICALARYYAEPGIEPPSKVEAKPQDFETQVRAVIDPGVPVLSFVYGIPPSEIVAKCRRKSVRTIATATTPEEPLELERAGIDLIVASAFEGGGHRGSFLRSPVHSLMGSFSLIPQVVDAVQLPVVAAGGIADGRGLKAALALGAEGVQIGTAFLACAGSGANTTHREALLSKGTARTELTDKFTGRLARGIKNHLMDELTKRYRQHCYAVPPATCVGANGGAACFHVGSSRLDDSVGGTKLTFMSSRGCGRVNVGADCGVRRPQEIGVRGAGDLKLARAFTLEDDLARQQIARRKVNPAPQNFVPQNNEEA